MDKLNLTIIVDLWILNIVFYIFYKNKKDIIRMLYFNNIYSMVTYIFYID